MYKILFSFLFVGAALTAYAQGATGQMSPDVLQSGEMSHVPVRGPNQLVADRGFTLAINKPIVLGGAAAGSNTSLTLKSNELVMERSVSTMLGDLPHTDTQVVWSIPFSGSAQELDFQPDGDLVIRDASKKVLWAANVSGGSNKRLMIDVSGKLAILDKDGHKLWEK